MFGPGSWQTDGPRKSAWQTIDDLSNFKREIIAREQFVDDPDRVLSSVKDMVDAAIKQINDAATMGEREDRNNKLSVPPNDRIELPSLRASPIRIPIAIPQTPDQSVSPPGANAHWPQAESETAENSAARPQRYLRGRLVDGSGRTVFETGAPPVPFVRSGPLAPQGAGSNQPPQWSSGPAPAGIQAGGSNAWPAGDNGSGQALPIYPLPAVLGGADPSAPSGADMSDWFTRWVKPLMQT
jgi:hypothetical protein